MRDEKLWSSESFCKGHPDSMKDAAKEASIQDKLEDEDVIAGSKERAGKIQEERAEER